MNMKKIITAIFLIGFGLASCKKGDIRGINNDLGTRGSYLTLDKKIKTSIDPDHKTTDVDSIKVGFTGSAVDSVRLYVVKDKNTDSTSWSYIKTVDFPDSGHAFLTVTAQEIANALYGGDLDQLAAGDIYTIYNMIITKDGRHFSTANTASTYESEPAYNMAMQWGIVLACPIETPAKINQFLTGDFQVLEDEWDDFNPNNPANNTVTLYDKTTIPAASGITLGDNQFAMLMYPSPTPDYPPGSSSINRQYMIATIGPDGLGFTFETSAPDKRFIGTYVYPDGSTDDQGIKGIGEVSSCNGKGKVTLHSTFFYTGGPPAGDCCYESILLQK
jgi:hypothetical protein